MSTLRVATWNVYLGAEIEGLANVDDFADLRSTAAELLDVVRRSRFPARADVMANVIAELRPDVLALQELGRWERGASADGDGDTIWDYQQLMLAALERAGLSYAMAHCVDTFSGAMPVDGRDWARFTSCDALLLRQDVDQQIVLVDLEEGMYDASLEVSLAGLRMPITRGWIAADLEVGGRPVRVVSTHLDSLDPEVRCHQAEQLTSLLRQNGKPVVLLGDLNTNARGPAQGNGQVPRSEDGVLEVFGRAGFADAWLTATERHGPEQTLADTRNLRGERSMTARLDYVLYERDVMRATAAHVAGVDDGDRTPGPDPLWPSDHGCLVVDLELVETADRA